jgi:hypothetical protein
LLLAVDQEDRVGTAVVVERVAYLLVMRVLHLELLTLLRLVLVVRRLLAGLT